MEEMERAGGAVGVGVGGGQAAPGEGVELARLQQHHQAPDTRHHQTSSMLSRGRSLC